MRVFGLLLAFVVLAVLIGCSKKTEPAAPVITDKDRLQGVWAVEWIDRGRGATEADLEKLVSTKEEKEELAWELDRVRQGRIEFKAERVTMALSGWEREEFTFALDETQDPKVMILTVPPPKTEQRPARLGTGKSAGPPPAERPPPDERLEWIYKFDGEVLIIALIEGGARPTQFKARRKVNPTGEPGVTVLTLKKTEIPPKPDPGPRYPTTKK
jgi:uncharacterized protein (TIGR03067 family)